MPSDIKPFDMQRMFLGDLPTLFLLEIVFRTGFMYIYMLLIARFIGKRGIAQITPFEFIIVIILGSAAGDPMFYPDVPLIYGIVVLTTVVILEKSMEYLSNKYKKLETFIESEPTLVIKDGEIIKKALEIEKVSRDELLMQLRMKGVLYIDSVKKAFLEPSGKLSVFQDQSVKSKNHTTLPDHSKR